MTNARTNNLPAAPTGFAALSAPQQRAHRERIGVRAQAILSQFWRDDDTPDAIQAIEIEGWCDVLENCSHSEIRAAWAQYQRTGPRSRRGTLIKPDAGAIYHLVLAARPKPTLVKTETEDDISWRERQSMTPEQVEERRARAAEIMSEIWPSKRAAE